MEASEGRETERMAKSAVQSAAKSLTYFIQQKDFHLSHVEDSARTLRNKLNALFKDVDGMRGYNESVQLIKVANDIKNVIDSFICNIAEQRGETSAGWMNYQSTFNSGIKDKPAIEDLGKKIFDLKTRLDDIILSNTSQYGIHNIQASGEASTSSTQSQIQRDKRAPIVEEAEVVSFEDETRTLVGRLIAGDMRRVVISITGKAGTGKTTLAKKVYDDVHVRRRFDIHCFWVNVPREYLMRDILLACISTICPWLPRSSREMTEEDLRSHLREYLQAMKYLVVIDEIWSREAWDDLITAFPDSEYGCRVLLTTHNEEVAKCSDTQSTPHKLRFLNESESWTLFCKKALLWNPSPAWPQNLEELGRRMVAKCGGLPLAITVLGGFLSRKEKSVYEWEKMLRSVEWWLHESEEDVISGILALSYDDLPYYLKPCFLYFAVFPEDSQICVDELIRMWIAEGFVQRRGEKEMEDVAEDYIEELIIRSMIHVDERKSNGMANKCRIHYVSRDLAISKAKDERFLDVYGNKAPTSPTMAGRLATISGDISKCISLNSSTPHLFSVLDFSNESDLPEKLTFLIQGGAFKFLRVMHLQSSFLTEMHLQSQELSSLPDEIGDLIHLRYLRLEMRDLKYLPSTITRLSNLLTLDIQRSLWFRSPLDDIVKMEQIRHLIVDGGWFSNGFQLHHLSNLRTLKTVKAGSWIEDGLENLTNLRDLEVVEIRGDVHMALSRSISKLVHLRSLCLKYGCFFRFNALANAALDGRSQKLDRYPMVTLEKLPNLRSLCIYGFLLEDAYMGKEMVCSAGGFPLLDTLTIDGFHELEEWRVEEGAMRNLRCLEISNCRSLKMLPDGLRHVTTLQELKLKGMSKELKERVRKNEGEDWFKIRHIPSLIVE